MRFNENTWLWVVLLLLVMVVCFYIVINMCPTLEAFIHSFTHSFMYLEILYLLTTRPWGYNRDQKPQYLPFYNF